MLLGVMGKSGGRATLKPVGHQVEDDWLAGNFFNTGPTSKILPCNTFFEDLIGTASKKTPTPSLLTVGGTQSTRVGLMYSSRSSPTAYQPLSFFYINWNTQGFPFHFLKKKNLFFKIGGKLLYKCCVGLCHTTTWISHNYMYIHMYIYMCVC